jgi:hypothetical protein
MSFSVVLASRYQNQRVSYLLAKGLASHSLVKGFFAKAKSSFDYFAD